MIPSRRAWIFRGWSSRTRRCGGRWTTRDTGRYNSGHMNAGTKFAIGAVLIVGSVGYLMASGVRSEEHTSELQSHSDLVCRLLLEKKKEIKTIELTRIM